MRRQYDIIMSVFIDAEGKGPAKLNSFADRYLPVVVDHLRHLPLPEEGTGESHKKMTLKSVVVRRKNKERA